MNKSLQAGTKHDMKFVVPQLKTVPNLYPESEEFARCQRDLRQLPCWSFRMDVYASD
ncbi:hypothetical protein I6G82_21935 [Lysinibacillus macroides]|uniref:hypothetical protein n=1 Tax=Lysinibacillus macroides TaxID=33935 RepID=UPI000AD6F5CF|nr:hypothetical protein [Lysinibacillus macroides]QPR67804.1 hypothetical protein I6G82_21935 [Lysinibacillus macroides]